MANGELVPEVRRRDARDGRRTVRAATQAPWRRRPPWRVAARAKQRAGIAADRGDIRRAPAARAGRLCPARDWNRIPHVGGDAMQHCVANEPRDLTGQPPRTRRRAAVAVRPRRDEPRDFRFRRTERLDAARRRDSARVERLRRFAERAGEVTGGTEGRRRIEGRAARGQPPLGARKIRRRPRSTPQLLVNAQQGRELLRDCATDGVAAAGRNRRRHGLAWMTLGACPRLVAWYGSRSVRGRTTDTRRHNQPDRILGIPVTRKFLPIPRTWR